MSLGRATQLHHFVLAAIVLADWLGLGARTVPEHSAERIVLLDRVVDESLEEFLAISNLAGDAL